jgi:cation transport ATPase
VMMSGDQQSVVDYVAQQVGVKTLRGRGYLLVCE